MFLLYISLIDEICFYSCIFSNNFFSFSLTYQGYMHECQFDITYDSIQNMIGFIKKNITMYKPGRNKQQELYMYVSEIES